MLAASNLQSNVDLYILVLILQLLYDYSKSPFFSVTNSLHMNSSFGVGAYREAFINQ